MAPPRELDARRGRRLGAGRLDRGACVNGRGRCAAVSVTSTARRQERNEQDEEDGRQE